MKGPYKPSLSTVSGPGIPPTYSEGKEIIVCLWTKLASLKQRDYFNHESPKTHGKIKVLAT